MKRRAFLKTITLSVNTVITLLLAIPGMRFLFDPLQRKTIKRDFQRIAALNTLPKNQPIRIQILDEYTDAYTNYPTCIIGSVWLQRTQESESQPQVRCFQTICPHLGCGIDFNKDREAFFCPCHASEFDRTGQQQFGPSPRDMDELECRITEADEQGIRWIEVKYQTFLTGKMTPQPIES